MEKAIKRAIEGGWKVPHVETEDELPAAIRFYTKEWQKPTSNPLFWQALGKAEGWKKYTWTSWKGWNDHWIEYPSDDESYNPPTENAYCQRHITYILYWHRFIDSLAQGQTVDDFFNELL